MHVIVSTHKLGDLPAVVETVLRSPVAPESLVVTCDAVVDDVARYCRAARARAPFPLILVQRAFKGNARRGQTRNNGVRALLPRLKGTDTLYFLDGDVCPDVRHLRVAQEAGGADVIVGRVVRLTEAESAVLRREGADAFRLPLAGRAAFARKVGKAKLARSLRRLPGRWLSRWVPPYWPDLRSGNFAARAELFLRVNGFDESMTDWGIEDSDLGLRMYRAGARAAVFPWGARAYHLWHPTAAAPLSRSRVRAWLARGDVRAAQGLATPFDQADSELRIEA